MTTIHSIDRTLERSSIKNPREAKRFLNLAILRGKHPSEFNSHERNWLIANGRNDENVIVYNGYCIIVIDDWAITMYKLPRWFGKTLYDGKKQIRRAKQYYKHHPSDNYGVRTICN